MSQRHKKGQRSIGVLAEGAMVHRGIDYWESLANANVSWKELKSAKEFETGMGESLYTGGLLSRWTPEQVDALQSEMEATVTEFRKSIIDAQEVAAAAADNGDESAAASNTLDIPYRIEIEQIDSVESLGSAPEQPQGHRRTRTAALRIKLENMQQQLNDVTRKMEDAESEAKAQSDEVEKLKNIQESDATFQTQIEQMKAHLASATEELQRAEEAIAERDIEVANLKRQLEISQGMNAEIQSESAANPDEALKQRVKDANRYGLMLSAMQEQLDFERLQFTGKIKELEREIEHRDARLNSMFKLYNDLIVKSKQAGIYKKLRKNQGASDDAATES